MAAFADLGAMCAEPSCGRQDFLPFACDACAQLFCQAHFRHSAHRCGAAAAGARSRQVVLCPRCRAPLPAASAERDDPLEGHVCAAAAGQPQQPALRCAAKGCREALAAHNKVRCWRCSQDVCIRHRFEEDHPCVSVESAVATALGRAHEAMAPGEFAEAHETLLKVFGNILNDPLNEKYRSLKKSNAVVSQKLRHPACVEALKLCGFTDTGEAYACRTAADLSLMVQMAKALKAHPPAEATPPTTAGIAAVPGAGGGAVRLVNGVILRQPPAAEEATAAPTSLAAPGPQAGAGGAAAARPRTAFDFERKVDREQREKAQEQSLEELRRLQRERYRAGGGAAAAAAASSGAPPSRGATASSSSGGQQEQPCSVQ